MAGDWIKMRGDIHRDPKVIGIAEYLAAQPAFADWAMPFGHAGTLRESLSRAGYEAVTLGVTVTGLLVTWSVTRRDGREDGDDMVLDHCTIGTIDRISGVPGFGAAMQSVEWAIPEGIDRIRFPKCLIHLTSPEERERKLAAERKRRQRVREGEKLRDINRDASRQSHADVTPREDKSREEIKPPKSPKGDFAVPDWVPVDAWAGYVEMRIKNRKPMTKRAMALAVTKLEALRAKGYDPAAVLDEATEKSWQGIYEPKNKPADNLGKWV